MTNFKNAIQNSFNKAAANYDYHAKLQRVVADNLFAEIKNELNKNQIILDAGSGTGYFHELLRKNKIYCPLIQADIAFNMCKKSAEYASPPEYGGTYTINSDIESLPLSSEKIDIIFSSMTLQWTKLENAFAEFFRILKPGGKVAFSIVGENSLAELSSVFNQLDDLPHINNFHSEPAINNALATAGFKNIASKIETTTQHFDNVKELLNSIKGVGASYKTNGKQKFLGKNYFQKIEEIYRKKYADEKGLPLSWNIIYVSASK
jgi:malonyl-CoA O-methyltransferase